MGAFVVRNGFLGLLLALVAGETEVKVDTFITFYPDSFYRRDFAVIAAYSVVDHCSEGVTVEVVY